MSLGNARSIWPISLDNASSSLFYKSYSFLFLLPLIQLSEERVIFVYKKLISSTAIGENGKAASRWSLHSPTAQWANSNEHWGTVGRLCVHHAWDNAVDNMLGDNAVGWANAVRMRCKSCAVRLGGRTSLRPNRFQRTDLNRNMVHSVATQSYIIEKQVNGSHN